jgi:ABC-type nitrate/sulfonate/bicarbonate transport system ATPase subunit
VEENLIQINDLKKAYSDDLGFRTLLFENLAFEVGKNKLTTILAPVGAGKSSLLKLIGGLDPDFEGDIKFNKSDKFVFIPSEPSSFPWSDVRENLLFSKPDAKANELDEIIKLVGLEGYESHRPVNKSIGFRFRISLGRALILKPAAILLDQPFDGISPNSKFDIYRLIRRINSASATILLATTNISEALLLSDQIHLMRRNPGSIIASYNIDFPAERGPEIMESDKFIELRTEIEKTAKIHSSQKLFNFSI